MINSKITRLKEDPIDLFRLKIGTFQDKIDGINNKKMVITVQYKKITSNSSLKENI